MFFAIDQGTSTSSLNVPVSEDMLITPSHTPGSSTTIIVQVAPNTTAPQIDSTKSSKRKASTEGPPQPFAKKNRLSGTRKQTSVL